MEYAAVFLICKPRLVYCMYFAAMERCYLYRESKLDVIDLTDGLSVQSL